MLLFLFLASKFMTKQLVELINTFSLAGVELADGEMLWGWREERYLNGHAGV